MAEELNQLLAFICGVKGESMVSLYKFNLFNAFNVFFSGQKSLHVLDNQIVNEDLVALLFTISNNLGYI